MTICWIALSFASISREKRELEFTISFFSLFNFPENGLKSSSISVIVASLYSSIKFARKIWFPII